MHQLTLTFESASPINKDKLGKQNKTVFEMLERGTITCYDAILVGIFNLHSRISDWKKGEKVQVISTHHGEVLLVKGREEFSVRIENTRECNS